MQEREPRQIMHGEREQNKLAMHGGVLALEREERGRLTGLGQCATGLGLTLGPVLAGLGSKNGHWALEFGLEIACALGPTKQLIKKNKN